MIFFKPNVHKLEREVEDLEIKQQYLKGLVVGVIDKNDKIMGGIGSENKEMRQLTYDSKPYLKKAMEELSKKRTLFYTIQSGKFQR